MTPTTSIIVSMALVVGVPKEEAIVLGAFQRACELAPGARPAARRRSSGGAAARIAPGVVVVRQEVTDAAPDKILNRAVRPLLRALTKAAGRPVSYFGRDWIACAGRPVGMVAFSHEAASGRAVLEAFVSARTSVWLGERASHRGQAPTTLDLEPARIAAAVAEGLGGEPSVLDVEAYAATSEEPAWEAVRDEAIGIVAAGRDAQGALRVGGELMASCDAIARLEASLAAADADAAAAVDAALGAPGVAVFGVRSLASVAEVVAACKRPGEMPPSS